MKSYNSEVVQIAQVIKQNFYATDLEENQWNTDKDLIDWEESQFMEKAEKIHQYFPNVEEARRVVNFLSTANPVVGRLFVEQL